MKIGFIGAGNVGFSLGKYLVSNNIDIKGYYSINREDALKASQFTDTECYSTIEDIVYVCDTLFLTVNDDALNQVIDELIKLKLNNKILIHTSGAKSSSIFRELNDNNYCYSLHPIYAFNDKYESYKGLNLASFTLEGNDIHIDDIRKLFLRLGNKVAVIDKNNKAKYHASCVMISNLVTGLIDMAFENINDIGIDDPSIFYPLILNNINNIINCGTVKALTGPVVRNDIGTVEGHLNVLSDNDKKIYALLSERLIDISKKKNNNDYQKLESLLEENV
ncbi:MAG: DUF2520 domain-containing protein [Acholeplasmatales bacterium]|nr:DUF2520 domain-containing protein [Acholeplasmatales bacterium]